MQLCMLSRPVTQLTQGQKQLPVAVLMSRKPNSREYLIPSGRYHIQSLVCHGRWESIGGRRRV